MSIKPPLPPFTRESAIEKSVWPKMRGTAVIHSGSVRFIQPIPLAQPQRIR